MKPFVIYHPGTNRLILLVPNIGEYWMNFKIISRDHGDQYYIKDDGRYEGSIGNLLEAGWEIIGDF